MKSASATITPQTGRELSPTGCSIVLVAALLVAFWVIAAVGAHQAARDERVWGVLDPLIGLVRSYGPRSLHWLLVNDVSIGWLVTVLSVALVLAGLSIGRLRAAPLVPLAVGAGLATWGQVALSHDRTQLGAWLYGGGIVCSLILGIWCPLTRLGGVPRRDTSAAHLSPGRECVLVFGLTMMALFMRIYALTELPSGFDLEIVWGMVQSRTLYGLRHAFLESFLGNAPGMVHMATQMILFKLFGASIYTIRLGAVFWGVAAVPLLYWLVRRIAGVAPAVVATLLFLTAPEQLYWSRSENAFFAPIAALALITAHLGLWMVERFSLPAVLATALWMPFCRYFYLPGMIMVGYPLALCAHALVFVRGAWRKAWYAVPLLAGGAALWAFSISMAFWYLNGGPWRFINPAMAYGAPAWTRQGAFGDVSVPELIRLQTVSVAKNLGLVIEGMAYVDQFPTHWYGRYTEGKNSALNVGLVVILALGIGYIAGQFYEPRSAVLLAVLALGVLPACMSNEATVRRMSLIFPAAHATAGIMMVAAARAVRVRVGPRFGKITAALLGVALVGLIWTNLVSHFAVPIGPFTIARYARFAQPLFENCDAIFTDLEAGVRGGLLLDSLDRFIASPPCYQYVGPQDWLDVALHARCDFADQAYARTMPPARLRSLQTAYAPRRVCYLLGETPSRQEHIDLLRGLYPAAAVGDYRDEDQAVKLVVIAVDASERAAVHSPTLTMGAQTTAEKDMETGFLTGVQLTRAAARPIPPLDDAMKVQGGIVVEHEGWYHFDLAPQCAGADLTVDQHRFPASDPEPMLAGVHAFEINVSKPSACPRPLQVLVDTDERHTPAPLAGQLFVNPAAVLVPQAQAPRVVTYPGYGDARVFARLRGAPADLGVDADGHVSVLARVDGWEVQRFNPDGHEEAHWELGEPRSAVNPDLGPMVVGSDGTCVILTASGGVLVFDRDGNRIGGWDNPLKSLPGEVALWRERRVLIAMPLLDSIASFTLDGKLEEQLGRFDGGPGKIANPKALAVSPAGDILVIQYDGQAVLFRNPGPEWNPTFIRSFRVDFSISPVAPRGSAFDGEERILIADIWKPTPLVYSVDGERLLATTPERDLGRKGFGMIGAFQATDDRLYVLDRSQNVIWSVAR